MRLLLASLLFCACTGEEKDSDTEAPPVEQDTDTAVSCEGEAPELTELVVEDYGDLYEFEDGPAPALLVAATGEDNDGDLHRMNLVVWWDDAVDGSVDTSGEGNEAGYYEMNEAECGTSEATYGIIFEVDGERFDYETAYEFAAVVYDAAGLASEVVVASGTTPAAVE